MSVHEPNLDDVLDRVADQVMANPTYDRTLIKHTAKLQIGIIMLDILTESIKRADSASGVSSHFIELLRKHTGHKDEPK